MLSRERKIHCPLSSKVPVKGHECFPSLVNDEVVVSVVVVVVVSGSK